MATATAKPPLLQPEKTIHYGNGERIVFDHTGEHYRAARYYRLKLLSGKIENTRTTATAAKLEHLFCALFAKEYPDTRVLELIAYVRATTWGERLP